MAVFIWVVVGACMVGIRFGCRVKFYDRTPGDVPVVFLGSFPSFWQLLVRPDAPMPH